MKEKFKSFYQLSEEELENLWSDNNTVFIFDTNILLNLYQYSEETREEFLKVLEEINDRIWIPFHVALEYQNNRLSIIKDEKSIFTKIDKKLQNIIDIVEKDFADFNLKDRNPSLFKAKEKFKTDVYSLVENFKEEVSQHDTAQPCVRSYDEIRERLDKIFKDKIGEEPKEEFIKKIYEEGEDRYKKKIPPGYKDINKEKNPDKATFLFDGIEYKRKYGDLIIWKQIIEYAIKNDSLNNIVYITDDTKEDWWELIDSRGEKVIGARPELKDEIYREAKINYFEMYHTNGFLTDAKKYCGISVDDKAIDEARIHLTSSQNYDLYTINKYIDTRSPVQKLKDSVNASQEAIDTFSSTQKLIKSLNANREALDALSPIQKLINGINANQEAFDTRSSVQKLIDSVNPNREALDTHSSIRKLADSINVSQGALDKALINSLLDNFESDSSFKGDDDIDEDFKDDD